MKLIQTIFLLCLRRLLSTCRKLVSLYLEVREQFIDGYNSDLSWGYIDLQVELD